MPLLPKKKGQGPSLMGVLTGSQYDLPWFVEWLRTIPPGSIVFVTDETTPVDFKGTTVSGVSAEIFADVNEDAKARKINFDLRRVTVEGAPPNTIGALGPAGELYKVLAPLLGLNPAPINYFRLAAWGVLGASVLGAGLMIATSPRFRRR